MQAPKTKAEIQQYKAKLANSYTELLEQFSTTDLRHVGNYTLGKLIGKGSFGKVYLARHDLTNGSKVVLKASKKDDTNLAREIHHHRQFIHPHIARLYEVIVTESIVWLVLEYCPGDELYNYLCRKGALPVETVQKIFSQLVGAVAYIHSKACVHRDLKLENVLLDKHENVKLCDFGFTREYEGKASYLQTFCGTVCYSAPEMLRGEKYAGEKVDVWSLGIILYALLKGELPFDEDDDMATKQKILKDDPTYPDTFPEAAKTLISKLLSKRPFPRPTLAEVLSDPFLINHAPQQQAILKLSQPAPFTTNLEKLTLERMKTAGVDIDKVIENVLSQRCDSLAGWWALLIEKEARKEAKRERKRKEREAEIKLLRRWSGASSRLDRNESTLEQVNEEGLPDTAERRRSGSRGRTSRRNTPQILVGDIPQLAQLPEDTAIDSPGTMTPPPPIDKDSVRSQSNSRTRPLPPPKERARRKSSTLQLVTTNAELLRPVNGVNKRRSGIKRNNQFLSQLTALKQWFIESTKRAKSPNNPQQTGSAADSTSQKAGSLRSAEGTDPGKSGQSLIKAAIRTSPKVNLTPDLSRHPNATNSNVSHPPRVDSNRNHKRDSLSPSPMTPRSSSNNYNRRPSAGLHGRKSTSSSVSSIRSLPRHANASHSKASSRSSTSTGIDTIHSPSSRSLGHGRSPHTSHSSIKVVPSTPTTRSLFPSNTRTTNISFENESALSSGQVSPMYHEGAVPANNHTTGGTGVMFARRKKSPFKGPMLNSGLFGTSVTPSHGSPALRSRYHPNLHGHHNLSELTGKHHYRDLNRITSADSGRSGASGNSGSGGGGGSKRKSLILEEDEEAENQYHHDHLMEEDEEEEIEEVDAFTPIDVDIGRGERVCSITIFDDPDRGPGPAVENDSPPVPENGGLQVEKSNNRIGNSDANGKGRILGLNLSDVDVGSGVDKGQTP